MRATGMNDVTGFGPVGRRGRAKPFSGEPTRLTEP